MRPLEGIRVLDLSRLLPGPFATLVLADLGASVDKLEDAGSGDYLRHLLPGPGGTAAAFSALNRGKRSAVLDLKTPGGSEAFRRILPSYDVLIEQFRPGVMARLGLAHESLLAAHPRLVLCALSGYGQTGPLAERAGHDLNYLAHAGLLSFQGPAGGAPQVPGFQLADIGGALWSVIAILAALRERERTGRGRLIDLALADGVLGFATPSLAAALNGLLEPRGAEPLTGGIAPYRAYLSRDGQPVTLAALEPKFWQRFCSAVGRPVEMEALIPGPHQPALVAELEELFASRPAAAWEELSRQHDCCVAVAARPEELGDSAHHRARGAWLDVPTAQGPVRCFRTPVSAAEPPTSPAPAQGQHTRQVLVDGGLGEAEIDELLASSAARQASPPW